MLKEATVGYGMEYKMCGHSSDPCTLTILDPLCSPYVDAFSSPAP